jgi:hypothetical protein
MLLSLRLEYHILVRRDDSLSFDFLPSPCADFLFQASQVNVKHGDEKYDAMKFQYATILSHRPPNH